MSTTLLADKFNTFESKLKVLPKFQQKKGLVEGSKENSELEEINNALWILKQQNGENWTCYISNKAISSIKQGTLNPTCGLVALAMGMNMLHEMTVKDRVKTLLEAAVELQITKKGEMFSALNMKLLVEEKFPRLKAHVVPFNEKRITEKLLTGVPVLVPYDSDFNFSPCCKRGHHAHWAVLTGVAVCTSQPLNVGGKEIRPRVVRLASATSKMAVSETLEQKNSNEATTTTTWVFAKQGKSVRLQVWKLSELMASNANLLERNPGKSWEELHCPFDLKTSLCGLVVELEYCI